MQTDAWRKANLYDTAYQACNLLLHWQAHPEIILDPEATERYKVAAQHAKAKHWRFPMQSIMGYIQNGCIALGWPPLQAKVVNETGDPGSGCLVSSYTVEIGQRIAAHDWQGFVPLIEVIEKTGKGRTKTQEERKPRWKQMAEACRRHVAAQKAATMSP